MASPFYVVFGKRSGVVEFFDALCEIVRFVLREDCAVAEDGVAAGRIVVDHLQLRLQHVEIIILPRLVRPDADDDAAMLNFCRQLFDLPKKLSEGIVDYDKIHNDFESCVDSKGNILFENFVTKYDEKKRSEGPSLLDIKGDYTLEVFSSKNPEPFSSEKRFQEHYLIKNGDLKDNITKIDSSITKAENFEIQEMYYIIKKDAEDDSEAVIYAFYKNTAKNKYKYISISKAHLADGDFMCGSAYDSWSSYSSVADSQKYLNPFYKSTKDDYNTTKIY